MYIRKIIVVLGLLGFSMCSYAQGGKTVLFNIVHNMATGKALIQMEHSLVAPSKVVSLAPNIGPNLRIKHAVEQAILPGYFFDFSSQLVKSIDISAPGWPEVFVANLDGTKTFEGKFVSDFKQAVELLDKPVLNAAPVSEAFANALLQATEGNGRGFLVLAEAGNNPTKAKDVFILDLNNKNWISLNKSKGRALSSDHNLLRTDIRQATPLQQEILNKRGVLIEVDNETNPTWLKISRDGVTWESLPMETPAAQNLWAGWQEGFYMSYNRHTGNVMYATGAGQPQFNSLQVLKDIRAKLEGK